ARLRTRADPVPRIPVPRRRAQRRRAEGVQPSRPARRPALESAAAYALGDRLPLGLTRNFPLRPRFCWGRASNLRRRRSDARTPRASAQRDRTLLATSDGRGLRAGMVVAFPRSGGARISRNSPGARLRATRLGLIVHVPSSAHSGRIKVLMSRGRYTSSFGPIYVFRHALHPPRVTRSLA